MKIIQAQNRKCGKSFPKNKQNVTNKQIRNKELIQHRK